jgi:hypothetical protein
VVFAFFYCFSCFLLVTRPGAISQQLIAPVCPTLITGGGGRGGPEDFGAPGTSSPNQFHVKLDGSSIIIGACKVPVGAAVDVRAHSTEHDTVKGIEEVRPKLQLEAFRYRSHL